MSVSDDELGPGLRFANALCSEVGVQALDLAARLAAVAEQLEARGLVDAAAVDARHGARVDAVLAEPRDSGRLRVELGADEDKRAVVGPSDLDCASLWHLCHGRCCSFHFALSPEDLDEGVVKWDYARPYIIRQSPATGRCVHQTGSGGCGVYEHRPAACRRYDCRNDRRIWKSFRDLIPAATDDQGNPP